MDAGTEITPNLLQAMVHSGSYLSGAFIDNKIVGAAFAFPATNNGNPWSVLSILTLPRQGITRILYYDDLYRKILDVHGAIRELGVQWGTMLVQLIASKSIYEPYNHFRKIYGP